MAGVLEPRTFLGWAFIVVLALLVGCVCLLGWLIFNLVRQSRQTGDPQFDQYIGPAVFLYAIFFICPAVTAILVLGTLLILLVLLGHV
jgi:hypothetical protein